MGLIFKQSFKSSIYSYLGAVIGFVNVALLMTHFLSPTEIGVRMQIQSYALIISSVIAFGIPNAIVRMFPYLKNETNKNHGVLSLLLIITIISIGLFTLLFYFFGDFFFQKDLDRSVLFSQYFSLIIPFTIANLLFIMLDGYATANKESTIGIFVKQVGLRVFVFALLLAFVFIDNFDFNNFINGFTILQIIPAVLLLIFLASKKLLPISSKVSFPSLKVKKEFLSVSLFNWVNVISSIAIISIDSIMLSKFEGSQSVGIYTILFSFSGLMLITGTSLGKITNSVIAEKFKETRTDEIASIFKKSALNPFIIGLFLFGNLVLAIPFIFQVILKNQYNSGYWVLIFLGLANLIKMATGLKFILISNSKYYRWITGFQAFFLFLLITTNLVFIPKFGITGAALASLISSLLFQCSGLLFVKVKLNMSPFTIKHIKLLFVFLILGLGTYILPDFGLPIEASIIKSIIFSTAFIAFIIYSKISPEFDTQLLLAKNRFKGK